MSLRKKLGLVLMLMAPFTSLSWIIVTFLSAFAVVFNLVPPASSLFNNPIYVVVTAVPIAVSMASGAWALRVQGLMTARNMVLIPALGYASGGMLTLGSMGFFYGVFDRMGFFLYRTPKSGSGEAAKTRYFRALTQRQERHRRGRPRRSWRSGCRRFVLFRGVWFLSLSFVGFGVFTLKSMNLSRHLRAKEEPPPRIEIAEPAVAQ